MAGIAIVAIPNNDDYIWNISSEKVPHMTIMYLGENVENIDRVRDFVLHTVKTSLNRFALSVNRRGVLGDQNADVLFFDDSETIDRIKDFRSYLLMENNIRKAYESTEQFPTWIPHLTLGYPETPAKPDKRDYPGIRYLHFDRIAFWDGDYEGAEFHLSNNDSSPLYMSSLGENFIKHYGVKGMRWGVRRDNPSGSMDSEDHSRADEVKEKISRGGTRSVSNRELQDLVNRMNLEMQYSRLQGSQPTAFDKGKKFINNATFIGQTLNTAIAFTKSPAGQLIRKSLIGV